MMYNKGLLQFFRDATDFTIQRRSIIDGKGIMLPNASIHRCYSSQDSSIVKKSLTHTHI